MNKSDIMKAAELIAERVENMSVGEQGINELYRNAQALLAAAALLKQVEWQPIESAPKNGTQILCHVRGGFVILSWYFPISRLRGRWGKYKEDSNRYKPTHWQPLPQPPINNIDKPQ